MLSLIVAALLLCTLLFAVWAGGKVERIGAAIAFANVAVAQAVLTILPDAPMQVFVALDVSTAIGFGVLAVRNPDKLWPGVAGVAMTFVMVFSATRAIGYPLSEAAFTSALNLSGLLVQAALVAGAWSHRWGRQGAGDEIRYA